MESRQAINSLLPFLCRYLPPELAPLIDLALDVRWTWNHGSDNLWMMIDPQAWEKTRNPWWILQSLSQKRVEELVVNEEFHKELRNMVAVRHEYLNQAGWFRETYPADTTGCIAYFSMEFGLGEEIPIYAGGLGMLAGDHLKTASDLNIPLIAVGLLYQEGYFRQILSDDGTQVTANPHNDPTNLPLRPVTDKSGAWLRIPLELPGRKLLLRLWQVQVGRILLYLLDSNDPMNDPADRSIIYKLYDDRPEFRLMQEMALGIGGWRALEAMNIQCEVCHLNEGHAAFAVLERARSLMAKTGISFPEALWATRAGNVFTAHTAVSAGFDAFPHALIGRYLGDYAALLGITPEQLLTLGRRDPGNADEPFNMAFLATRGCTAINGVSRLHEEVSKRIFQPLYPHWPQAEVPVGHITNGVHMPSWDCKWADQVWMNLGGKGCWCREPKVLTDAMQKLSDKELWTLRTRARGELVEYVRQRLCYQYRQYSADLKTMEQIEHVLDPNMLTLGFARRFASYKRPNLLLRDPERLMRILTNPKHPVQLVVAGKAHPKDEEGMRLVQEMVRFCRQQSARKHAVFVPDYDIQLAQHMVQGVDVWLNTPRRPWEACGTSGMKVLVNGGLNLSELDGWWAEAYSPEVGWAIGDGQEHDSADWDAAEAEQLYRLLEQQIVSEFYERDTDGIPTTWLARVRNSLSALTPRFSSNRMLRDYTQKMYLPAVGRYHERTAHKAQMAGELREWHEAIQQHWAEISFGKVSLRKKNKAWHCAAEVNLGGLSAEFVRVELYADSVASENGICQFLTLEDTSTGKTNCYLYWGNVTSARPVEHFSLRIIPFHPAAIVPLEDNHILWKYPLV